MRTPIALSAGLILLSFAAGCSSANTATSADEGTEPTAEEAGNDPEASTAAATTGTPAATPAADPAAATTTPAAPAVPGLPGDGTSTVPPVTPPVVTLPPGTTPPPGSGAPCANGGVREVDNNETPETATDLGAGLAFCGSISSAADVDHIAFVLPADAKGFGWNGSFSAGTTVTISAGGVTKSMQENPPWFPGQRYVIRISSGAPAEYAITLNIPR